MRIRRLLISSIVVAGCGGSDYADYFLPTGAARSSGTAATSTTTGKTDGGADASGAGGARVDAGSSVCRDAATWAMGKDYKSGTSVRAVCMNPGGGLTVCEVGVTYLWICKESSACATYAPGVDGWWSAWTLGMRCS